MYNASTAPKAHSTAKVYDDLFVRHWDEYTEPQRQSVWYATLAPQPTSAEASTLVTGAGLTKLHLSDPINALAGTALESPMPPFPSAEHFSLSETHLSFVVKDTTLNPALHTKCNIYVLPLSDSNFAIHSTDIIQIPTTPLSGAITGTSLKTLYHTRHVPNDGGSSTDHDRTALAFLAMSEDGYESDRTRLCIVPDLAHPTTVVQHRLGGEAGARWDRSPDTVFWSNDGYYIYLTADDVATRRLFVVCADTENPYPPQALDGYGSVSKAVPLVTGFVFASSSSLHDSSTYTLLKRGFAEWVNVNEEGDVDHRHYNNGGVRKPPPHSRHLISSLTDHGRTLGLSAEQVAEFWYPSPSARHGGQASSSTSTSTICSPTRKIHALVIQPPTTTSTTLPNKNQKHPLALLIHGGPQSSWTHSWSTRWNPHVLASAGFTVIMPNITGSTGYGAAFTDAIAGEWGGKPYEDLVALMDYLDEVACNPEGEDEDEDRENESKRGPGSVASSQERKARQALQKIDTTRSVALGASYGGYMINWLHGQPLGKRFKALVCHDGIFDTLAAARATDELYFPVHDFGGPPFSSSSSSDDPTTAPSSTVTTTKHTPKTTYEKWNPSLHTNNWSTPTLVIHSARDFRLPISEGLAAFNALREKGVRARFLTFGDEGHFVLGCENARVWWEGMVAWCEGAVDVDGEVEG